MLFCFIKLAVIFELFSVDSQSLESFNENIDFEVPHVIVNYDLDSSTTITLEAFTTKNVKQIVFQKNKSTTFNRLTWMSLGYPKLLEKNLSYTNQSRIFHFYDQGFYAFIETLNKDYKNVLTRDLFDKYSINVDNSQILNIPLAYFGCEIVLYDQKHLKNVSIIGKVRNFNQHPYKLIFNVHSNSTERNLFEEKTKVSERDIFIDCKVESRYKHTKTIENKILPNEIEQLKLSDKIFGENEFFVYLTRYQFDSLSSEIFSSFEILEIDEDEFNKKFYDQFVKKVDMQQFTNIKFDQAIKFLSKYSVNMDKNKSVENIKKELSRLFKVNKNGNNLTLSIDKEYVDNLRKKNKNYEIRIGSLDDFGGFRVET